jgi:hypothetical protein
MMKFGFAVAVATLALARLAVAQGLTPEDFKYLQETQGLTPQSAVIGELTPNEQQALHSAIDDLKTYPAGQTRQVRRYLTLVYGRECKRWAAAHPGQKCSPAADPAVEPGKEISDRICASCHLFGTETAPSLRRMAGQRDWDTHKVDHQLRHNHEMVPLQLTPDMLNELAAYINSFK